MTKHKLVHGFIITTFVVLYLFVSLISTIHVVSFFELSNKTWLAITLAIAFEIGAAASLASLIVLEKMNRSMVYLLFIVLTLMQAMGNTYYAYSNLHDFQGWIELFGLTDYDVIAQKRILAIVSGAVLPLVALGFIKSLVDYIKPDIKNDVYDENQEKQSTNVEPQITDAVTVTPSIINEEPEIVTEQVPEEIVETFFVPEIPTIKEMEPETFVSKWDEIDNAPDSDLIEEESDDKKKIL